MARTLAIASEEVEPGTITRSLLNTATAGSAVIAKILVANGLAINSSTGADSGTGDVTLGLGNITPTSVTLGGSALTINSNTAPLQVISTSATATGQTWSEFTADATGPILTFYKSRSPTAGVNVGPNSGDSLAEFDFWAPNNNTTIVPVLAASIKAIVDGTPSTLFVPSRLEFWTGASATAPRLAGMFDNSGRFILGNNLFNQALTVNSLTSQFQILGASNAAASQSMQQFSADATGPTIQFYKTRQTAIGGAAVAVSSGDVLGKLSFVGVDTAPGVVEAAYIQTVSDGSPGSTNVPSRIEFYTGTNSAAPALQLSITSGGNLVVGGNAVVNTFNSLSAALQLKATSNSDSTISLQEFSNDTAGSTIQFFKSRGVSLDSYTILASGDTVGKIDFIGVGSTTTNRNSLAYELAIVDGTPGTTFAPGRFEWYTGTNAAAPALAMKLDSTKTLTLSSNLVLPGVFKMTPQTQPSSPSSGWLYFSSSDGRIHAFDTISGGSGWKLIITDGDLSSGNYAPIFANVSAGGLFAGTGGMNAFLNTIAGVTEGTPTLNVSGGSIAHITYGGASGNTSYSNFPSYMTMRTNNAAPGSSTRLSNNDILFVLSMQGDDALTPGTNFIEAARYQTVVDGVWSLTSSPARHEWYTCSPSSIVPTLKMKLDSTGRLGLLSLGPGQPAAADSGYAGLIARDVGGRKMLGLVDETGQHTVFQPHWGRNNIVIWDVAPTVTNGAVGQPTTAGINVIGMGTPTAGGNVADISGTGTYTTLGTIATTNFLTRLIRLEVNSAATSGNMVYVRSLTGTAIDPNFISMGAGSASGGGGFHIVYRFAIIDGIAAGRFFAGVRNATGNPTNADFNTLTNCIGIAALSTDTTQFYVVYGGTTAQTAIACGVSMSPTASNSVYEVSIFQPENSNTTFSWQITRLDSPGTTPLSGTVTGTTGTQLPGSTLLMNPMIARGNAASSTAAKMAFMGMYLEMDN
jgi:hypothetical protein